METFTTYYQAARDDIREHMAQRNVVVQVTVFAYIAGISAMWAIRGADHAPLALLLIPLVSHIGLAQFLHHDDKVRGMSAYCLELAAASKSQLPVWEMQYHATSAAPTTPVSRPRHASRAKFLIFAAPSIAVAVQQLIVLPGSHGADLAEHVVVTLVAAASAAAVVQLSRSPAPVVASREAT